MRRENTHGRSQEDVENQRPDNIRKTVFRPEPEGSGQDGGFTAVVGKGKQEPPPPADDGGGDGGGDDAPPDGGGEKELEDMTVPELKRTADTLGVSTKGMNKAEMVAMIRASQQPPAAEE
jgi:hypothetical protein